MQAVARRAVIAVEQFFELDSLASFGVVVHQASPFIEMHGFMR